jgi:hypothetical protein
MWVYQQALAIAFQDVSHRVFKKVTMTPEPGIKLMQLHWFAA